MLCAACFLIVCLTTTVVGQSVPYFGDDIQFVSEFMITTGPNAGLSTGNYFFAYSRSLNTGLFQRTCCYDSKASDMSPISYIRNYSSKAVTTWYIGKQGSCTVEPNSLGFADVYADGTANLMWLDENAVRSPDDDKTIGVWPCEAWKFNWTAGTGFPNTECVTYIRQDSDGNPIPVMTDLVYELNTFGRGAEAWYSFYSNTPVTFEFLNQWQDQDCQPSKSASKVMDVNDYLHHY